MRSDPHAAALYHRARKRRRAPEGFLDDALEGPDDHAQAAWMTRPARAGRGLVGRVARGGAP